MRDSVADGGNEGDPIASGSRGRQTGTVRARPKVKVRE